MASKGGSTPKNLPVNYLCDEGKVPEKREDQFYEFDKVKKTEYGYVYGTESHTRRRKMILERHPEVAKLLVHTKPYSIILAFIIITFSLTVTYFVKVSLFWNLGCLMASILNSTLRCWRHTRPYPPRAHPWLHSLWRPLKYNGQ